ncbi:hypothetical protein L1987_11994 [Smallanthus sonchifolius]|uniref:Uncharacterized protein n=1 Tax=Smallanthus sonchifolius TaxID=185202 RepID=A0ACB9JET7_9ASTR|nr:hypothetical protein L1987_11994 [Smallanthus sonchifolius]
MATCLNSRTRTLLSQKPRVLSSFFTERWFGMLPSQDHLHKSSHFIVGDLAVTADGLRASFSTCLGLTDKPVVMDAPSNIFDEKHKPQQDQYQLPPKNCLDLFKAWGCNNQETSQILQRMPSLYKAKLDKLQSKLQILRDLGFTSSDLVKIISCRPRFLKCRINNGLNERVQYLEHLLGSKEILQKAILRNPSVLTYDVKNMIKPTVELYRSMGITGRDLTLMLLSRPTIIPRTSLNAEKLEYIRKTGTTKDSKMYKYVVTLVAISRLETIREKISNLEKFGFMEDEVFRLLGTSPLVMTLSVDKVQRNMTFVVASMKQPARVVLEYPFLLYKNLEKALKPRMILATKIDNMGLDPSINGPKVFTALRMTEKRFVKVFINCHPPEIAKELMKCYVDAKHVKRLAEKAKKTLHKGFPF